jgi:hypothetical protein
VKYFVHHTGYVSHVEEVEANSPEEAIDASEVGHVQMCSQCSSEWDSAGDPDVFSVSDENGETVWENYPEARALPTLGELKDSIRTALGGDTEEGCGCESHICEAAGRVLALLKGGE